jgi:flavin-dependent dehydrogenase
MKSKYDCVVIGGGPAGCSAASIVAEAGFSTLLIERDSVPRFHVGESLMPETHWPLQRLGMAGRMRESAFQVKKSVQFVTHDGRESAPFFFRMHDDRDCSETWQVQRSEFDQLLFERAAELGAECHDCTRLLDVQFDAQNRATGVVVKDSSGQQLEIECSVVVDGSGQQSFLANKLGLKRIDQDLKKVAIWTYYDGATRDDGDNAGATIILNTETRRSWFWFIPLSGGQASIGCVGDTDFLLKGRGTSAEVFAEELARCPGLTPRLKHASATEDVRVAKEFSYQTTAGAGDGWVLIGDAFGFIDPVYSSGVYFALEMGVRAGDAIAEGLKNGDLSSNQLGSWCESFENGSQWIRKLVRAFYTEDFSIGRFMKEHPEHRGGVTDLLIGRIFHEGAGDLFADMDASIKRAKKAASK